MTTFASALQNDHDPEPFQTFIEAQGRSLYRDLPWRETHDAYLILLSECMLQQTQVARVQSYWPHWTQRFPTVDALAAAPLETVLESWQGLGYNRRAIAIKRAAELIVEEHAGVVPEDKDALLALPGVGPSTAAGVRVFAFEKPDVYVETNVRAVFIHTFFPDRDGVSDREIIPLVQLACPDTDVRAWYYSLLDYGAYLKSTLPNPTRRSRGYTRQSVFEGSRRQKRAWLLRAIMARGRSSADELIATLQDHEMDEGRMIPQPQEIADILGELERDGFVRCDKDIWSIRDA